MKNWKYRDIVEPRGTVEERAMNWYFTLNSCEATILSCRYPRERKRGSLSRARYQRSRANNN